MSEEMVAGRYRLDELIGRGPSGEVWRAHDERADWTVAVKILAAGTRQELTDHAQAVARVVHPNVAMVLDIGEHDEAPFLVMEFLTGQSLGEELAERGPLPIVEVCDLVGQAAAGLDAAHRAGVVHRQVEPDSFRRAGSGVLKAVGFAIHQDLPITRYRAPEQLDGSDLPASDLYALGCVAYELLCGRPPFTGFGDELAGQHRDTAPEPPRAHRAEIPAELDQLVLALLTKDPAARPASGEVVRRRLAAIARPGATQRTGPLPTMNPQPQSQPQSQPNQHTEQFQQLRHGDTAIFEGPIGEPPRDNGNRKLIIQAGAALAVILVATIAFIVLSGRDQQPVAAPTTPTPSATVTTEPEPEPTPTGTTSPDPGGIVQTLGPQPLDSPVPRDTSGLQDTPPGGWEKWLSEFDKAVGAEEQGGTINPKTAEHAHKKLDKALDRARSGNIDAARSQAKDLARDLVKAGEKGEFRPGGPLGNFLNDWGLTR
ncbi:serine/threonine protein kinase [Nonomuraea sp. NBC_01738]|uniref:serine/threonine-protein kinase n=1 Tax=Nonomuraea sp. NBC_01738 TaxID=2976003 RepID=UPI002E1123C2|nr:serine/threonine protein kinase [Nonomuraea sp. NBC_01738]